ncbi:MAG TPA: hypothetical protein VGH27_31995 [Streptosporangiaceae bacterium]
MDEPASEDRPGDPACWLNRVCPRCGTLVETESPVECPSCHTRLDDGS